MTRRVPSTDGVDVAIHELAGTASRQHPVLLVSHATGFHGHAYLPIAKRLAPAVHSVAFDFRGHGDTPAPPDWTVDWESYGDDAVAAAVEHALFAQDPKRRYLVVPNEPQAQRTIRKQIAQLVELNEGPVSTYDRATLIKMLDDALAGSRPGTQ